MTYHDIISISLSVYTRIGSRFPLKGNQIRKCKSLQLALFKKRKKFLEATSIGYHVDLMICDTDIPISL